MIFDLSISLGGLINTFLFVGTTFGVYLGILRRLDRLEAKVDTIWAWFVRTRDQERRP